MGMLISRHTIGESKQRLLMTFKSKLTETFRRQDRADLRIIAQQRGLTGISAYQKRK